LKKQNFSIIKKLGISYECALSIGNSLNLSEMLHEVIHTIVHRTNAHRGNIWIREEKEGGNIKLGARAGLRLSKAYVAEKVHFFHDTFEKIWEDQQPVIKNREGKDFLKYCTIITGKEESVLIVPIKDVAIIHLVYADREMVDETLGNMILGLSQKLSTAVNACLAYQHIERAEQIQSTLYNIANAVNTTKDLNELFVSIRGYLGKIIDTTNFFLALYDKESNTLSLPFLIDEKDSFTSFPPGKTLTAYVIRTGKSILATKEVIEQLVQTGKIEIVGTPAKIWLGVPLKIEKEIIGVVVVQSYTDASLYTEKDMEILEFVSDEIAMVVKHKKAVEELAAEKERLNVTLRSVGDGVITTDIGGKIVLMNKVAEKLTGWSQEDAEGKPLEKVFHIVTEKSRQPYDDYFKKVVETGGIIGPERDVILIAKNRRERIIAESAAPIRDQESRIVGVVLVFRDITEKRKIEEELLKASKLESVGILAGGIAHDFNNILTAIIGNLSLARLYDHPGDAISGALTKMEKAALQAKKLTQQLLTFARGGTPIIQTTSITELITESAKFTLRGSNVSCEFFIPPDLWFVNVDEGQMSQVINNLIINADQAMPEGGKIKVSAENITVGEEQTLPIKKGKYVKITIKDRGIGISKEHLERIFDPYFTTKQKGSGFGLAITYSIIKRHQGHITVESEVGVGTTFSIYLPASFEEIPIKEKVEKKIVSGSGKILVMDDEEVVRDVAGEMLKQIGYEVEFARDGAEAIELYNKSKESGNTFDAVILDLTVPGGMGGVETIKKLLEIDPAVKAIVSSGYSNDPVMANFSEYGFAEVVPKPYEIQKVGEVVRKVLVGQKEQNS
jgi:PAS domain S-box-containing protein